jgi:uncharacterized protein (UPF0332 family)
MPRADTHISSFFALGASKTVVRNRALAPLEAAALSNGLRADGADLYYSGWVSFLDALHGINKGFYTWATIKLYYSVFYAFGASLAYDDVCTFHVNKSYYTVLAQTGAMPVSCTDRGTHKTVLKAFQRRNPNHALVSQQIDLEDAVDWLMHKRESANYGQPRFSEPGYGHEFSYVVANGLRKTLNAYVTEPTFLYVFDPDHAIVAYPLRALQLIGTQLMAATPAGLTEDEKHFLRSKARDDSGSLSTLLSEMKRLTLLT